MRISPFAISSDVKSSPSPSFRNHQGPAKFGILTGLLLVGCQAFQIKPAVSSDNTASLNPAYSEPIAGIVTAGLQPLSNASVQLYQIGTSGNGSAATPLLTTPVLTDGMGAFSITGAYSCTDSSYIYVVAKGGNPGLAPGTNNSAAALMSALGQCGSLSGFSHIAINELTTVASVSELAPFMQSYSSVGVGTEASDAQPLDNAFNTANTFVDMVHGTAQTEEIPAGQMPPTQKLQTLSDILASCVNSSGGVAGDSSACGELFATAMAAQHSAPTDTIAAIMQIAQNPTRNVVSIYELYDPPGPFQPTLASAPSDWALEMTTTVPIPTFSPAPGTYSISPSIILLDSDPAARIYYTMDGSIPSSGSSQYLGAVPLTSSATIRAVAILGGLSSLYASGAYTLPTPSVSLVPGSVTLTGSQNQTFTAAAINSTNPAVTWSLSPAIGSISPTGLYAAPSAIASSQTVTVIATSVADSTKKALATIILNPPVGVSLNPGSTTLTPSQNQTFTTAVINSTDTTVTWSLSPAIGSVSSTGVYTAPATIASSQTVTLTATSVADSTKKALATVILNPPVSVSLNPGSTTLTPSQNQAFTAAAMNSTNPAVTWSLSPAIGSLSSTGVYTAPAIISSSQTVTVTATSISDSTKKALATIFLNPPVSSSLIPGSTTLTPSQNQAFTVAVLNSANPAVTWSLSPAIGSISSTGVYTAPATIASSQTVTVTATSVADSTKKALATVILNPPVSVSLNPGSTALAPSQPQAFLATVANSTNPAVTWSLSPAIGSISSTGVYTAPATIASSQTVTVTATSIADSTQTASATVSLVTTLRDAASHLGLLMGAAADAGEFGYPDPLTTDPLYASTLSAQYSMLEPENAMKWNPIHPAENTYAFQFADELVAFANQNNMKIRGHNLVWNSYNPDWINEIAATGTTAEMSKQLQQHIQTVVSHYKGQVFAWDVVNEAIDDSATGIGTTLKDSIWYNQPGIGLAGTGYIEQAFRWAHEADPNALLFYNDYNVYEPGAKFQAMFNMLQDFVSRGVPIDGVGLQMHIETNGWPNLQSLAQVISQIGSLGLQVHITEMDVSLPVSASGTASPSDLQAQATTYQQVLAVCLSTPDCTAFQTWGFTDKHSWIPASNPGLGAALPFDINYQPKPAFGSLLNGLTAAP
jgi:GH35 family endo-1,4-beta-xylanase